MVKCLHATEAEKTKQTTNPPIPTPPKSTKTPVGKKAGKKEKKPTTDYYRIIVNAYDYECSQHHASFHMYIWGVSVVPPDL